MAVMSEKGDVQLVCGGALLNIGTASEYAGQVVSVYADKSGLKLNKISGGVGGDLLPKEGTLGGRKLRTTLCSLTAADRSPSAS